MHPSPAEIKALRKAARLTQTQAAKLVWSKLRTWQDWEAGKAAMHPAIWHSFKLQVRP